MSLRRWPGVVLALVLLMALVGSVAAGDVPCALEFDGSATSVDYGSAADIDNLPANDFAMEFVLSPRPSLGSYGYLFKKFDTAGMYYRIPKSLFDIQFYMSFDTTPINRTVSLMAANIEPGSVFHVALVFDAATKTLTPYLNGIAKTPATGVGNYSGDAAATAETTDNYNGQLMWFRISDTKRYTDTFDPPDFNNPPAPDLNTLRQFNFRDGAGTTLTDATGTEDGTITMGGGRWACFDHGALFDSAAAWWDLEEESGTRYAACGSQDLTDNNTVSRGSGWWTMRPRWRGRTANT